MNGRIIPAPPSAHRCEGIPRPEAFPPGTIWECNDCSRKQVVVIGSQYNETYYAWRNENAPTISGESRGHTSGEKTP